MERYLLYSISLFISPDISHSFDKGSFSSEKVVEVSFFHATKRSFVTVDCKLGPTGVARVSAARQACDHM